MRFLITGITGFAARHLTELLLAQGHEVFGTTRAALPPALPVAADHVVPVSLYDRPQLTAIIDRLRPDGVFHLAAATNVAASFADPEDTYRANLFGSVNVFAAVHAAANRCRVMWIGSSTAYGQVRSDELPVTEYNPFRPLSPYAVSKAAADLAAFQWAAAHELDVIRLRPFNHTGPGQSSAFVCADFARQVAAVERGMRAPEIHAGNLDVVRDFTDVRDVVRAYVLAFARAVRGEAYNVCSGQGYTPGKLIETLLRLSGTTAAIVVQPGRRRGADVPVSLGSAAKLHEATGWVPAIPWEQTLRDLLEDWRKKTDFCLLSP